MRKIPKADLISTKAHHQHINGNTVVLCAVEAAAMKQMAFISGKGLFSVRRVRRVRCVRRVLPLASFRWLRFVGFASLASPALGVGGSAAKAGRR